MGNNWTSELERRRAGEVPGFIGTDETIEDFEKRHAAEVADELDGPDTVSVSVGVGTDAAGAGVRPRSRAKTAKKAGSSKKR